MYVCLLVSMYVCLLVSMYVCLLVSMYVCPLVRLFVCLFICFLSVYWYIFIDNWQDSFRFGVNHLDVAPNYAAILMGISNTGNYFIFLVSFKLHIDFKKFIVEIVLLVIILFKVRLSMD